MRKKDYDKYYNKKFVGLNEEDEKQLEQIINKIKFFTCCLIKIIL